MPASGGKNKHHGNQAKRKKQLDFLTQNAPNLLKLNPTIGVKNLVKIYHLYQDSDMIAQLPNISLAIAQRIIAEAVFDKRPEDKAQLLSSILKAHPSQADSTTTSVATDSSLALATTANPQSLFKCSSQTPPQHASELGKDDEDKSEDEGYEFVDTAAVQKEMDEEEKQGLKLK